MAATIKDIAQMTGLGAATISAYLNGVNVRPINKDKIEQAINELGYVRNEYARGLKMHRTMTIGVLIPELSNSFSTAIISEMEDILRAQGYGIIVCDCRTDSEIERKSLRFLMSKMVDGLIVMPISTEGKLLQPAIDSKIPIVVIDRATANPEVSMVVINNREIARNAVQLLINNGHKHIAVISGDSGVYTVNERNEGYREAIDTIGTYNARNIYNGSLSVDGGYLAMKRIIESNRDITAVFVTNYEMTIGAIIAVNELGYKIPNDYSFVGFDNQELSRVISPRLATVNQPLKEIGRTAATRIIKMIGGEPASTTVLEAVLDSGLSIKKLN